MLSPSSFRGLDPIIASTSSKRPSRPTGPVKYKNLQDLKQKTCTHKEFVGLMKGKTSSLKMWHDHKTALSDLQNDPQEVFYAVSENFTKLVNEFPLDSDSIRAMFVPPEDFCGLDVLEQDLVFDKVTGHERIMSHCLSHISKGEAFRENGLGTSSITLMKLSF